MDCYSVPSLGVRNAGYAGLMLGEAKFVLCANGQTLRTIEGSTSCVDAVAITRDGRRAVSKWNYGELRVWDLDSGQTFPADRRSRRNKACNWRYKDPAPAPQGTES
jgi:WD40 repeat protein